MQILKIIDILTKEQMNNVVEMEMTKLVIVMEMIIVERVERADPECTQTITIRAALSFSLSDSEISDLTTYIYYILQCTYDTHTHTNIVLLLQTLQGHRPRRL